MSLPSVLPNQSLGLLGRACPGVLVLLALPALLFTGGCGATRSSASRSNGALAEEQIVLTRRPRAVVEVSGAAFEAVMFRLAADVHAPPRPFEGRLVYASWQPQGGVERELADGFRLWCSWKQSSAAKSGCESILEGDGRWLKLDTREAMALSIAMSSVWDGAVEAVKGMVDPAAFQAMVYTSLATCMALLLVPEPVTKALMVAITVGLCTYLGWSTVWGILQGWKRLKEEAGAARTFDELSAAGERFGKLLGANTARVMVMVTTMALGSAAGAALKGVGPNLPAWGQAAQLAAAEGLAPALAVPAASVMVVGDTLTIGMTVGPAVAMAASTPTGSSQTPSPDTGGSTSTRREPGGSDRSRSPQADAAGRDAPRGPMTAAQRQMAATLEREHPGLNPRVAQEAVQGAESVGGPGGMGADVRLRNGGGREVSVHSGAFTDKAMARHLLDEAAQENTTEIFMQVNSAGASREAMIRMVAAGLRRGYNELDGIFIKFFGPDGSVWWSGRFFGTGG